MIRKLFIALVVLLVVAGGAYFMFGNKNTNAEVGDTATKTAAASPTSQAPANGEFWTERCNEEGDKYCEVFQRLMIKENNQRLIEFAVGYPKDAKGVAQAAIVLPLGVLVNEGIALKVDEQAPAKAAFRTCIPEGCVVVMNLPEAFIATMKKGTKITVSFLDGGTGKQVNIDMSLQGFGKKVDGVKS